jgi:prepilin signal peptidase PulO-like enzyme (type II secretory pathway)
LGKSHLLKEEKKAIYFIKEEQSANFGFGGKPAIKTIPFAPFIFLAALLSLILKNNIIIYLTGLLFLR